MNIPQQYKPVLSIGNQIAIWGLLLGLITSMVSFGNDLENEQLQANERQKELIKKMEKQEAANEKIDRQLKDNRDILIEIRTKQESM